MGFNSYRYPRDHLTPPTPADEPWSPVGPGEPASTHKATGGEIDLTKIDLTEPEEAPTSV